MTFIDQALAALVAAELLLAAASWDGLVSEVLNAPSGKAGSA